MSEHGDGLEENLGISRRDLIRRGAIVGGALVWATPVIQSIGKAYAHEKHDPDHSRFHICCYCHSGSPAAKAAGVPGVCQSNGNTPPLPVSEADCASDCGTTVGSGLYDWHTSDSPIACDPAAGCAAHS